MSPSEYQAGAGLAEKTCKPCSGDTPPLKGGQLTQYTRQLSDEWEVVNEHHLTRTFEFDDFAQALRFVNRVGEVAERENHHPTIEFTYGKATIRLHTHKIDGLSESDFVLAAKIDQLPTT